MQDCPFPGERFPLQPLPLSGPVSQVATRWQNGWGVSGTGFARKDQVRGGVRRLEWYLGGRPWLL
jgi:hypothetical protein